jgi:hypothetical protein
VKGDYFYRKQLQTKKEEMASVINNEKVPEDAVHKAVADSMRLLTDALYETARYMLFHNKKSEVRSRK